MDVTVPSNSENVAPRRDPCVTTAASLSILVMEVVVPRNTQNVAPRRDPCVTTAASVLILVCTAASLHNLCKGQVR
jgi:hypothetical protein